MVAPAMACKATTADSAPKAEPTKMGAPAFPASHMVTVDRSASNASFLSNATGLAAERAGSIASASLAGESMVPCASPDVQQLEVSSKEVCGNQNGGPPAQNGGEATSGEGACLTINEGAEENGVSHEDGNGAESEAAKPVESVFENGSRAHEVAAQAADDKASSCASNENGVTGERRSIDSIGNLTPTSAKAAPFVPGSAASAGSESDSAASTGSRFALNINAQEFVPTFALPPGRGGSQDVRVADAREGGSMAEANGANWRADSANYWAEFQQTGEGTDCAAYDSYIDESQYQGEEWGGEWAGAGQENYSGEFADSASSLHYDAYYGQDGYWATQNAADYSAGEAAFFDVTSHDATHQALVPPAPATWGWGEAAMAVLEAQFPAYSHDVLQEILDAQAGNLSGALDVLLGLEDAGRNASPVQIAPELNEDNFPALDSAGNATPVKKPSPGKDGFAQAARRSVEAHGRSPDSTPPVNGSPSQQNGAAGRARRRGGAGIGRGERDVAAVPWKETGAAVSQAYAEAREQARDHARLRNAFFEQATRAFLGGDKALAASLGAQGRRQSDLMRAAHARACRQIYAQRNPAAGVKFGKVPVIDLHGLHVREALSILGDEIAQLTSRNGRPPSKVAVLVGTGHHTKGAKTPARLPAAVESWLKAEGYTYAHGKPGCLEISL